MQTFPSSETVLLPSTSPPLLRNPSGDDVDIDFRDVFGGPPKRRSKVNELGRHSFSDTALRRLDFMVDNRALVPRDDLWDGSDEKPVFGEDTSIRRRFTADDFFDDIFGANGSSSSSPLPGSRILSPAQPIPHEAEPPARQVKATEIPTFGSATRSSSKSNETASSSPLSRTSDMAGSAAKSGPKVVVTGKGRQFHFSIYKWTNNGVPVVIWGSSRLSSMAKAEQTAPSDLQSTTFEKAGKDKAGVSGLSGLTEEKKTSQKRPGVQKVEEKTEIASTLKHAFSGDVLKAHEASVKPLHSCLDDKDERQG